VDDLFARITRAKKVTRVVGFQLEEESKAALVADAPNQRERESTMLANRGMLSAKWGLMAIVGFTLLLLVRGADNYLDIESAVPYVFAIFIVVLSAFVWTLGDALLSMVCEATKSQLS
jgi:hypothetical protein